MLTLQEIWDSKEIMSANATAGLSFDELVKVVRATESVTDGRLLTKLISDLQAVTDENTKLSDRVKAAEQASRWESDLCAQALASLKEMTEERDRLKTNCGVFVNQLQSDLKKWQEAADQRLGDIERLEAECNHLTSVLCSGRFGDIDKMCALPPEGWLCTRLRGHTGPCAAVPQYER